MHPLVCRIVVVARRWSTESGSFSCPGSVVLDWFVSTYSMIRDKWNLMILNLVLTFSTVFFNYFNVEFWNFFMHLKNISKLFGDHIHDQIGSLDWCHFLKKSAHSGMRAENNGGIRLWSFTTSLLQMMLLEIFDHSMRMYNTEKSKWFRPFWYCYAVAKKTTKLLILGLDWSLIKISLEVLCSKIDIICRTKDREPTRTLSSQLFTWLPYLYSHSDRYNTAIGITDLGKL